MKTLCASSLALLLAVPARAASPEEVAACLAAVDVPCARAAADALLAARPRDPTALALEARTRFHEGRYADAVAGLERMVELHPALAGEVGADLDLYRATLEAALGFEERRSGDVVLRYDPGLDEVLLDEAAEALQTAREALRDELGALPPQPVLVEFYPTGRRFAAASGLGEEAVGTTGVVAVSKWARLLITSPRAVEDGYPWKDTVVHEYVHQVVSFASGDRTPVWLQEGVARCLEARWRGDDEPPLDPFQQVALARALAAGDLVTFEEMHPSFAFLRSAERGALAYAQVQVIVSTATRRGGPGTLARTLAAIRGGRDAAEALAQASGYADFATLMAESEAGMRALDLVERKLLALPVVVDGGGGEPAPDPAAEAALDLGGHARLGDLLLEADRPLAALAEYAQATAPEEPEHPRVAARSARCHRALGQDAEALAILERSTRDYPAYPETWRELGLQREAAGDAGAALAAFRAAADVDPFDPEVQGRLAALHRARGDVGLAARHAGYERLLRAGGLAAEE